MPPGTTTIETFAYPACAGGAPVREWNDLEDADEVSGAASGGAGGRGVSPADEQRISEAGRERGREEGRLAEREALAAARNAEEEQRRRQLAALAQGFAAERDRFLHAVEQEVVKLALAVAARILRREAQMDPLLLTGAVRVALGQLAAASEVKLLVPAAELRLWSETVAHLPNLAVKPEVAAGEGMRLGDCAIESRVGTVDLGVRSQLGEIERGFFDRAAAGDRLTERPTAWGMAEAPEAVEETA
jgi:flagellar assembly protein FliH